MNIVLQDALKTSRVPRAPKHKFQVRHRPFVIQPFMIAPVLPNETMKNLLLQARVVSDPVKNPLIGWWMEYHFFYVKHRDLDGRNDFTEMMLQPGYDLSAYNSAADLNTYHGRTGINWLKLCLDRIVRTHFRDQEDNAAHTLDGMPIAQIEGNSWLDSLIDTTVLDDGIDSSGNAESPEATDLRMQQWELMRQLQMTDMSYEDWLATFGVRKPKTELNEPELIRSIRTWQYPSNTIDPTTGAPTSALSWSIAERADKDRYFKEPGFIVGITLARPKLYLGRQISAGASMMTNAMNWLPALMADAPHTSLKEYANNAGPLTTTTNGYWVDIRDLLIYGDQFVNFSTAATDAGLVALPTAGLEKRYLTSADINALFVTPGADAADDTKALKRYVRQDGIVSCLIQGAQRDHT